MERTKLDTLIKEKNERLERDTLRTAESIIDSIAKEQEGIRKANERIAEFRTELKALSITHMNASELLGD